MYDCVLCLWWSPTQWGEMLPWWIEREIFREPIADNDNVKGRSR